MHLVHKTVYEASFTGTTARFGYGVTMTTNDAAPWGMPAGDRAVVIVGALVGPLVGAFALGALGSQLGICHMGWELTLAP
jgi:hypothetical protein